MLRKAISLFVAAAFIISQSGVLAGEILAHNAALVKPAVSVHGGTGIPVVNIVMPDARGVSHNRYDKFEVEEKGAVLNNVEKDMAYMSQLLGEAISANANFTGAGASVILNETVSGAGSKINGAVEIAGRRADFILADPYGISVNGGRFINAGKISLVTGIANVVEGALKTFTLNETGLLEIGSGGLDAGASAAELVSRYIKIGGKIESGGEINIKTGNKEYEYETGEVSSDLQLPAATYAVEATEFGSMYGKRIRIIATEGGFGVKTAEGSGLVSRAEDIIIESGGTMELGGEALSAGGILIRGEEGVNIFGDIISGADIKIESKGAIKNISGEISSAGAAELKGKSIENRATMEYGKSRIRGSEIKIEGESVKNISGEIISSGGLNIYAGEVENSRELFGYGYLESGEIIGADAAIRGEGGTVAKSIKNYAGKIYGLNSLELEAQEVENTALLMPKASGQYYSVIVKRTGNGASEGLALMQYEYGLANFSISEGGIIESGGDAEIKAGTLKNISSDIKALGSLKILSEKIRNEEYAIKAENLEYVYDKYEYITSRGTDVLKKTGTERQYKSEMLYAGAGGSLAKSSLISAKDINIAGLDGLRNALSLENIASAIKAENAVKIKADNINNKGLSDINLNENTGIKKMIVMTDEKSPKYGYIIQSYETAEVVHTSRGGEISGLETEISGIEINNDSSVIEGREKLNIEAENLTNAAAMIKDSLKTNFKITGRRKWVDFIGGTHDEYADRYYTMNAAYTFASRTVGEIKGGDIKINLIGNLIQDKNEGALQRAMNGLAPLYSNITGKSVEIKADNIENYGLLSSGGLLKAETANNFKNYDSQISGETLEITAGADFISETVQTLQEFIWNGTFGYKKSHTNPYGVIMSAGELNIYAGNNVDITRTDIISGGDADIEAQKNIFMKSLQPEFGWKYNLHGENISGFTNVLQAENKGSLRVFGNLFMKAAGENVEATAYNVYVSKNMMIEAGGDISLNPAVGTEKREFQKKEEKWFGDETERITYEKITNIGTSVRVNGKLELIAGNNINILASTLESLTDVVSMVAGMEVNVLAGEDYESSSRLKLSNKAFGLSDNKEETKSSGKTAASAIKGEGISIKAGKDANITGSDLEAGRAGILVSAQNDINIVSGIEVNKKRYVKEEGGTLAGKEINKTYNEDGAIRSVNMKSGGDITLVSGNDITSVSGKYEAEGDVSKTAGYVINEEGILEKSGKDGKVKEYAAEGYSIKETYHKKTDGLIDTLASWDSVRKIINPLSGFADGLEKGFQTLLNPSNVDIGISLQGVSASVSYKEEESKTRTEESTAAVNEILSGGKITLKAAGGVMSHGTQISAKEDINIEGKDILMLSGKNRIASDEEYEDKTLTTGMKVGNAYVDAGFAAKGLYDAEQALERAAYELREMEKLEKAGKASKEAVEDAKINLAMAAANAGNAAISLAASAAGAATAASSSYGTGLYAAGFVNYDTNKLSIRSEDLYAAQSNLMSGGDINFKSENDMRQEGANVYANGALRYDIGRDLLIEAGKNTMTSEKKSEHLGGGVSVGNNAVQVSASAGQSAERMRSTTYTNSESMAENIIMNVWNNAKISGANIHAADSLTLNIGNNLTIESLQDSYYAKGNSWDANVSVGIGTQGMGLLFGGNESNAGNNSIGGGYSRSSNYTDEEWVNRQTSLTGGNNVKISVGNKTTLTGGVIGSESGELEFSTKELEYKDIEDRKVSERKGFGIQTSVGIGKSGKDINTDQQKTNLSPGGSTTLSMTNEGREQRQSTKATAGQGNITIGGVLNPEIEGLNRDITNSRTITENQITGALDGSITVDNRLLLGFLMKQEVKDKEGNISTINGYQSIASDFANFGGNLAKATMGLASTVSSPFTAVYGSLKANSNNLKEEEPPKNDKKDIISVWKANQSANATGIKRAGQADVNEVVNKIKSGKATPEELQYLANYTSRGKGNLVYSEQGEIVDSTGKEVLGFNDLKNNQGYINAGNGTATNALEFFMTDAEERAHNYTSNEEIAERAARSEVGYYNAVSWLTGGETVGNNDNYGANARQLNWNNTYNVSNNKLLFYNTERANAVRESDKAYSTLAYRGTGYILGALGIEGEKRTNAERGLFGKAYGLALGTTNGAVERQDNILYGMQKAAGEYAKVPGDIKAVAGDIKQIPEKLENLGREIYEKKEEALDVATDVKGMAGSYLEKMQYAAINPGKTANRTAEMAEGVLFGAIRSGLNNDNLVYGAGEVFIGVMNNLALGYGTANLLNSGKNTLNIVGKTGIATDAEVFAQMKGSGILNGTADFYVTPSGTAVPSMNKLRELANTMDVKTAKDSLVLWSGVDSKGVSNKLNAEDFASKTGKTTLEMMPTGQYFDNMGLFNKSGPYTGNEAVEVFSVISRRIVENASGRVFVIDRDITTFRTNSILNSIEIPAVNKNPKITDIIREGGY